MRVLAALAAVSAVVASACASSADAPVADTPAAAATTGVARSAVATESLGAATSVASDQAEAAGVVGSVDHAAGVIDIRATGSASYTRVEVAPGARITLAGGGSLTLDDIRPSDRIIATGTPGDAPDTLVADRIEVSRVVPGAAPGG